MLLSSVALISSIILVNANGALRNKVVGKVPLEHRRLNWEMLAPGYINVANDAWYSDYDSSEIPTEPSQWADKEDNFRNNDLCLKDGSYSRANCPSELDCSHLNDSKIGPAKLCINRVPTATGMWFVLLQKCIPEWENCDKCLCGVMTSSGLDGVCTFDSNCGSDDSRIDIDCSNPSKITVMGDYTFNSATGEGFIDIGGLEMTKSAKTSSPANTKAPTPTPAVSKTTSTNAPVTATASKLTEAPVTNPTDPPVSAPKPTEPPVSTPKPTEPLAFTPQPTDPTVSTPMSTDSQVFAPTEAPASEEDKKEKKEKENSGSTKEEQTTSSTSTTQDTVTAEEEGQTRRRKKM